MVRRCRRALAAALLLLCAATSRFAAQSPTDEQISRAHAMLAQIRKDLDQYYYDSTFGGIDLDAKYRHADSTLGAAPTVQQLFGTIAQFLFDLKDSHTNFYPPRRAAVVEYGWRWDVFGAACFVTAVRKGSDAEKKGLAVGDQVLAIDGMLPTRQSIPYVDYVYYALNPRPGMHVVVKKPDGTQQQYDVLAKVTPTERVVDYTDIFVRARAVTEWEDAVRASKQHRYRSFGDTVLVWSYRSFEFDDDQNIDDIMKLARKHKALIIDLRDNGGGAIVTLLRLLGHFVDQPTRVGTVHTRNKAEVVIAKPVGKEPFRGNLVVLINGNSASASEITTRVLQLEGKATVVGDRSMGAVMVSQFHYHEVGFERVLPYAVQITQQDIVMADDGRLENVGVTPEFILVPTGADLAAKRDPQMAKALALVGIHMDAAQAAKIFGDRP